MFTIFLLIVLQLVGESIVQVSGLPVPGAIIGLVLLYVILVLRREIPDEMSQTSGFLLQNLGVRRARYRKTTHSDDAFADQLQHD